jgi:hypothetical protein
MSRTITISDSLYERLEVAARDHGFQGIEQWLEQWPLGSGFASRASGEQTPLSEEELQRRREAVDRTVALQERLSREYGMMRDSAELVREDRDR